MKNILITASCAVAALLMFTSSRAGAQQLFDDFSDLNDTANPVWTHLSGDVGSTGQTWDASTGQYHLTAPGNANFPSPPLNALNGYGFVGSYTGSSNTNYTVRADFVDFPKGVFGVGARLNGNNNINALTGYGYAYEPFAAGGLGEMVLYQITGANLQDIGSQQVTLNPSRDYTFILEVAGTTIHGQVWDIASATLVGEKSVNNAAFASGFGGVFGYTHVSLYDKADFTLDNFAIVPEPATGVLLMLGAGAVGLIRHRRAY
jgi:PEP-CTERM motif